jgi:hypothetical protein
MDVTGTVIESQPDWLTLTSPKDDLGAPFNWWGRALVSGEESRGNKRITWGMHGYTGAHAGRVSWGTRSGGAIICLSGDAAREHLDTGLGLCTNVSRLDIAATVRLSPADSNLEVAHYLQFADWHRKVASQMKGSLVQSVQGGQTCYVGSRASELFLRIYDKEQESRDPRTKAPEERYIGTHRYELEIKGDRALPMAQMVQQSPDAPGLIRATLASHLTRHGVDARLLSDSAQAILPGFRRRSDTDTKLDWLASQVRSTYAWLKAQGEGGRALRALGISALDIQSMDGSPWGSEREEAEQ